jgi:hypothetical protein
MPRTFKGYVPIEAPSFELESPDGARKITVNCIGMLPGSRFLDFLAKTGEDDPKAMVGAVDELLRAAVRPESWDEFKAFIDLPDNGIGMDMLGEITGYIGELYARRPTAPSEPSLAT